MEERKLKRKLYQKQYEELNKSKLKEYHKNRYDNQDKDFKKEYAKKYNNLKTKEYVNTHNKKQIEKGYRKEWHCKQYKNNNQYKLSSILRSRFFCALKNKNYKSDSIVKLLGCSLEECKTHLEQQFSLEMTWENHGLIWEIDHKKPCVAFDLTQLEEQQKCFHYTNLQPLFKTTEIAKSFGYNDQIGNRNKNKYL